MKTLHRFLSKRSEVASIAAAVLLALGLAAEARAEVIYGLTLADELVSFDSSSPGILSPVGPIGGLQAQEQLLGMAFGPGSVLFGVGNSGGLYEINPLNGAATLVGSGLFS